MAEPAEQIDQGQHAANAVNVHMASYYTENPAAWFSQIDSAFINARITSSASKFHLANSKLPPAIFDSIADLVATAATAADPYGALKTRLCDSFGLSPAQKIAALLDHPGPGDQKPSVLLDKIWALKPATMEELLYGIFFRRMPAYIRDVVHARNFETRQELAAICNKIWEERGGAAAAMAAAVHPRQPSSDRSGRRPQSPARGTQQGGSNRRQQGGGDRGRRRSPTPAAHRKTWPDAAGNCYYHGTYGANARHCRSPCVQENELAGGGH